MHSARSRGGSDVAPVRDDMICNSVCKYLHLHPDAATGIVPASTLDQHTDHSSGIAHGDMGDDSYTTGRALAW